MKTMGINNTVMTAMGNCTKVMAGANAQMDVKSISTMIRDFQKETMKTEMQNEMVGDAMDTSDAVGEEADDVYNAILGEIGMDVEVGAQTGVGAIASNK